MFMIGGSIAQVLQEVGFNLLDVLHHVLDGRSGLTGCFEWFETPIKFWKGSFLGGVSDQK